MGKDFYHHSTQPLHLTFKSSQLQEHYQRTKPVFSQNMQWQATFKRPQNSHQTLLCFQHQILRCQDEKQNRRVCSTLQTWPLWFRALSGERMVITAEFILGKDNYMSTTTHQQEKEKDGWARFWCAFLGEAEEGAMVCHKVDGN